MELVCAGSFHPVIDAELFELPVVVTVVEFVGATGKQELVLAPVHTVLLVFCVFAV